jgi:hypothetical protein
MNLEETQGRLIRWSRRTALMMEHLLACAIVLGVIVFAIFSFFHMVELDWRVTETFYELVYRILLMVIGVELARTLLTHDLGAILELLAFVVARKMLKPEITALDIGISVAAFVALLAAKRHLLTAAEVKKTRELRMGPEKEEGSKL